MAQKKLLIDLGSMGRGGAERVISLISDDFCKRGWKVYIVLLLFNKVDYVLNENITIINLSGEGGSRLKRLPGWFTGIRKALPSMRALAKDLHISVITTKRAYEELERSGFIHTVVGRGSFVAHTNVELVKEEQYRKIESLLAESVHLAKQSDIGYEELSEILKLIFDE